MDLSGVLQQVISDTVKKELELYKTGIIRPWVKTKQVVEELDKQPKWIIENFCTKELKERSLVKKIGSEWHFKNPEFFNYVHDEWWDRN